MFARYKNVPAVELLSQRAFRNLFLSNFTNNTGVELRMMAQSWVILELGASQFWVGAAMGLRVIPAIAIGLFAGVLVDRLGGRLILLWERLVLLVLAILTALIVMSDSLALWQIVTLSIVSSAVLAMGMPASQTLVRNYVPLNSLQAGNSLNTLAYSFARAGGPLLAGILIGLFGLASPFFALIVMYVLSTGFTYRMPKDEPVIAERASAIQEMMDGLRYIRSNPVISRLSLLAFSVIFSAAFVPIMPVYARDRFDVGETGFSFMLAAWAIGQGASALWISARRDPNRRIPAVLIATVMFAIAVPTFALSTNFPLTLFSLGIIGAAIPIWSSAVMALLQSQTDSKMIGRVMSVYSLSLQMMMLGWFLGAWIGELIGNSEMMLGGTAIYLVIHLWLIFTSPELRKL